MTPIHHLRMSHHSDAHESCTLMLLVSKHDAHLSPMERGNDESSFSGGGGDSRHDAHSSSEDESLFWRSWIMYIDAPSVKTWCSFITHGELAMMSHHFLGEGDPRHDAHSSSEDESSFWRSWLMYIDAPSVKTWRSFITHGEGAMMSHHFLGEGDPRHDAHSSSEDESSFWRSLIMYIDAPSVKTWRSFITHGEGAMVSHHFLGERDHKHDAHLSSEDESSSWWH